MTAATPRRCGRQAGRWVFHVGAILAPCMSVVAQESTWPRTLTFEEVVASPLESLDQAVATNHDQSGIVLAEGSPARAIVVDSTGIRDLGRLPLEGLARAAVTLQDGRALVLGEGGGSCAVSESRLLRAWASCALDGIERVDAAASLDKYLVLVGTSKDHPGSIHLFDVETWSWTRSLSTGFPEPQESERGEIDSLQPRGPNRLGFVTRVETEEGNRYILYHGTGSDETILLTLDGAVVARRPRAKTTGTTSVPQRSTGVMGLEARTTGVWAAGGTVMHFMYYPEGDSTLVQAWAAPSLRSVGRMTLPFYAAPRGGNDRAILLVRRIAGWEAALYEVSGVEKGDVGRRRDRRSP